MDDDIEMVLAQAEATKPEKRVKRKRSETPTPQPMKRSKKPTPEPRITGKREFKTKDEMFKHVEDRGYKVAAFMREEPYNRFWLYPQISETPNSFHMDFETMQAVNQGKCFHEIFKPDWPGKFVMDIEGVYSAYNDTTGGVGVPSDVNPDAVFDHLFDNHIVPAFARVGFADIRKEDMALSSAHRPCKGKFPMCKLSFHLFLPVWFQSFASMKEFVALYIMPGVKQDKILLFEGKPAVDMNIYTNSLRTIRSVKPDDKQSAMKLVCGEQEELHYSSSNKTWEQIVATEKWHISDQQFNAYAGREFPERQRYFRPKISQPSADVISADGDGGAKRLEWIQQQLDAHNAGVVFKEKRKNTYVLENAIKDQERECIVTHGQTHSSKGMYIMFDKKGHAKLRCWGSGCKGKSLDLGQFVSVETVPVVEEKKLQPCGRKQPWSVDDKFDFLAFTYKWDGKDVKDSQAIIDDLCRVFFMVQSNHGQHGRKLFRDADIVIDLQPSSVINDTDPTFKDRDRNVTFRDFVKRHKLSLPLYSHFIFEPNLEEAAKQPNAFNTFFGLRARELPQGVEPDMDLIRPIIDFDHQMFKNCKDPAAVIEYMEAKRYHEWKYPWKKTGIAPILCSRKGGAGKGLMYNQFIPNMIYGRSLCMHLKTISDVAHPWTGDMLAKVYCCVDEMSVEDTKWKTTWEIFKGNITDHAFYAKVKFKSGQTAERQYLAYTCLTNNPGAVRIPPGDRRFPFLEVCEDKIGDKDYFDGLAKLMANPNVANHYLTYIVRQTKYEGFNFQDKMPETSLREAAIQSARRPVEKFLQDLADESWPSEEPHWEKEVATDHEFRPWFEAGAYCIRGRHVTPTELFQAARTWARATKHKLDMTDTALGLEMKQFLRKQSKKYVLEFDKVAPKPDAFDV